MVEYEVRGHVALLTLNRPEARNAVNDVVAQTMTEGLDKAEADDDVWVIVLAADGTVFCAGADLKFINAGRAAEIATPRAASAASSTTPAASRSSPPSTASPPPVAARSSWPAT